jgi:hypothetical protein
LLTGPVGYMPCYVPSMRNISFRNLYQYAHLALWLNLREYGFPRS